MKTIKKASLLFASLALVLGAGLVGNSDTKEVKADEVWNLVTNSSVLNIGDTIFIAAKDSDYAIGTTQNKNNRSQASITKNTTNNTATATNEVQRISLESGKVDGTFAFNVGDGYLYASSSSANQLKTGTSVTDNSSWSVSITSTGSATITAQGTNTHNVLQYNEQSKLFACYGSASQAAVAIYKLESSLSSKVLTNITLSGQQTEYYIGETFTFTGKCTATFNDGTNASVTPKIVDMPDMSKLGEKEIKVSYTLGEITKYATYTINVTNPFTGEGTVENPYTVADALIIAQKLAEGDNNGKVVYVKGIVSGDVTPGTGKAGASFNITDGTNTIKAYSISGVNTSNSTDSKYVAEGYTVVVGGAIINYKGTLEVGYADGYNSSLVSSTAPIKPTIYINNAPETLNVNDDGYFKATVENATNYKITWSSSNDNVLLVTEDGEYLATSIGTAKVTASMTCDESSTPITTSVEIKVVGHKIQIKGDTKVEINRTIQLEASCYKEDKITWTCEPETVATISEDGKVTGIAIGNAKVTAKCEGATATYEISVTKPSTTATIEFSEENYSNPQEIETITIDNYIQAVFDKGSSSNSPKYYDNGKAIRVYGGNTFTISTDTTKNIASIILSFGTSGDGSNEITTDVGTFSTNTWTGSAQSITFTIGGTTGQRRIAGITVIYENTALGDFVDDWNTTIRGNENGLCGFLKEENSEPLKALIERYKALEDDNKAELTDSAGVKISESIAYAQNVWEKIQSTDGDYGYGNGNSGVVITSNNSYDKTSLIALFAILGIVTISAYYIIEKKKFSK